jgi:hypothetical protein
MTMFNYDFIFVKMFILLLTKKNNVLLGSGSTFISKAGSRSALSQRRAKTKLVGDVDL